MTFHPSIKELDDLGEQFHNWRQINPHRRIPKKYWDDALKYLAKYGSYDVAKSIGYSPAYIIQKQRKAQSRSLPAIEFVEIQSSKPVSELSPVQINIRNRQGVALELSFQGGLEQIFPLISLLFKEETSCCR